MKSVKDNLDKILKKKTLLALGLGQLLSLLITSTGFSSSELAKRVVGFGLGQLLSLSLTSTGFYSSELTKKGINAPTSQSFLNYVLLALVYGSIIVYRRQPLKAKWYYYILLAAVDVEANFLVVKAFQYTSITSVMLIDCWTIPCVLFLTWFFLKTKYRFMKLVGVVICIAGVVLVVFSDVHSDERSSGSNPIKGDLLVIAGATLYGVSNVSEEYLVKNADRVELMAFLGFFGAIISSCQISIIERDELKSIHWNTGATFPFVGFSIAMFLFYSGVPILLKISGSAMLNLSLLTSDMWAVVIRIFAYHEKVDWMYFVAFAAVALGIGVYSRRDKADQNTAEVVEEIEQSKRFDEEAGVSRPENREADGSFKGGYVGSSSAAEEGGVELRRKEEIVI